MRGLMKLALKVFPLILDMTLPNLNPFVWELYMEIFKSERVERDGK